MRRLVLLAALATIAAACGDAAEDAPGATIGTVPPTVTISPVTTAAPPTTAAPTTVPPPETSTVPPTTTIAPTTSAAEEPPPQGDAVFAITRISFGANGYVELTNIGEGPGQPVDLWLCQRPSYFRLVASVDVPPNRAIRILTGTMDDAPDEPADHVVATFAADGALGSFSAGTGEIGLYEGSDFGNAQAIRGFVEWGAPGGLPRAGRSTVAIEAGVWEGGIVEVSEGSTGLDTDTPGATRVSDWFA